MKIKTVLLKGPMEETLTYKLCLADPSLRQGTWEMGLTICSYEVKEGVVNNIVTVSSNYVREQQVNENGDRVLAPSVLATFACSGTKGKKYAMGFRPETFLEVTTVEEVLELYIRDINTGMPIPRAAIKVKRDKKDEWITRSRGDFHAFLIFRKKA